MTIKKRSKISFLDILQLILILLLPFIYMLNIVAFVFMILILGFLIIIQNEYIETNLLIFYLTAVQFSAISIVGTHVYDLSLIIIFLVLLYLKQGRLKIFNLGPMLAFLVTLLVLMVFNFSTEAVVDFSRYILALISFIIVSNLNLDLKYLSKKVFYLILSSSYFAIVIHILYQAGRIANFSSSLISSNIFLYTTEIRLNGFFTDPNKYLVYIMSLICIASLKKRQFNIVLIGILSMLLSLSRTSIICFIIYIMMLLGEFLMERINKKDKVLFTFIFAVLILISFLIYLKSGGLDWLITEIAKIFGREQTLKTASLAEDNRTYIWRHALSLIKSNPLIGLGLGVIDNKSIFQFGTHNTILSILVSGGTLLLFSYILFFSKFRKCLNPEIIAFVFFPLIVLDLASYRLLFVIYAIIFKILSDEAIKIKFIRKSEI